MTRQRMTILMVCSTRYPAVRGGVDTMIVTLVDQLRKMHNVLLFTAGDWEETELSVSTVDGVKSYCKRLRTPFYRGFSLRNFIAWMFEFPRTLSQINRVIRSEHVEIIHLHTLQVYQIYFLALRKVGGPPYIVTLHRAEVLGYPKRYWPTRFIWRAILRNAERVNAVSSWLAKKAGETFPFVENVFVIPNGINVVEFSSIPRRKLEATLRRPLPKSYFTTVGTLQEYKGQDVAIKAWYRLKQRIPDVHLVIVGERREHWESCEELIRTLNLVGRVHMLGPIRRRDVFEVMRHAIGMIFPSRNEGFGLVLLEAGAMRLPVICSDIPPLREIADSVDGEESVLFFRKEDPDALANMVIRLVNDAALRERLGRALYKSATTEFTAENMAGRYLEMYREVLQG